MDEGLTQRDRGSRGRGSRGGRGTVARERDAHSGKYIYIAIIFTTNIIIIILGGNVSITSMDEGLTQRDRGSRGRGTRGGRGTVARERDAHSGKYIYI